MKLVLLLLFVIITFSYQCPSDHTRQRREYYIPTWNGCGPQIKLLGDIIPTAISKLKPTFSPCCNQHDLCYQDCSKSQKTCDNEFKSCLLKQCSSVQCKLAAHMMYEAVNLFGKISYESSQSKACICVPKDGLIKDAINSLLSKMGINSKTTSISIEEVKEEDEDVDEDLENSINLLYLLKYSN